MWRIIIQKFYLFFLAFLSKFYQLIHESDQFHSILIKISSLICFVSCICLSSALICGYGLLQYNHSELSACQLNISEFKNLYFHPRRRPRYANGYGAVSPRNNAIPSDSYMMGMNHGSSSRDSSFTNQTPFPSNPNQSTHSSECKPCCTPGPPGPPGLNGKNGRSGECGSAGDPGEPAPIGFMPCLEDEIVKQLCSGCPSGPPGPPGDPGPIGDPGLQGETGLNGTPGIDGESGPPGPPGPQGNDGEPGEPGDPGENAIEPADYFLEAGDPGPPGPIGPAGEMGPPGVPSDMFLSEPGPKGVKGPPGEPGRNGLPGRDGQPGLPGISGEPGICPTYCAVDGGVFHDLSIVSSGNYIDDRRRRRHLHHHHNRHR